MSRGIETPKTFMESHQRYGYPKIVEISKNAKPFKTDKKDLNYDLPLSNLLKEY